MAYGSFEEGGITVQSSGHTDEQLAVNLAAGDDIAVETDAAPAPAPVEAVPDPKAKPRNDPRARVEAATAKEAEAKRIAAAAEQRAAKAEARIAELEAKSAPKPVLAPARAVADAEPTVDQFDSYEKFVKAQARWEARQEIRQQESQRQMHEAAQVREHAIREVDQQFGERYQAILAKDPEFPSKVDPRLLNTPRAGVLANPADATIGNFLIEQVFQSEQPDALLLYLSDPAVVQRLATLPPHLVIRELAKVELRAASPAAPALVAPVSHAKAPIRPVGTSPVAADANEITDDLSVDEHIRRMNARDRTERRRAS